MLNQSFLKKRLMIASFIISLNLWGIEIEVFLNYNNCSRKEKGIIQSLLLAKSITHFFLFLWLKKMHY